METAGE